MRSALAVLTAFVAGFGCGFEGEPANPSDGGADVDASVGDRDNDGVVDPADNCPDTGNANQADEDNDGAGDLCDSCPHIAGDQADTDGDGVGNDCDPQEGLLNTWLYFVGFNEPLVGNDWVGEARWTSSGGVLANADNSSLDVLRYRRDRRSNFVRRGAAMRFADPNMTTPVMGLRNGGVLTKAGSNQRSDGCWVSSDPQSASNTGRAFVTLDDDVTTIEDITATTIDDSVYGITIDVMDDLFNCRFHDDGEFVEEFETTNGGATSNEAGVVSSFTLAEIPYMFAIELVDES